MLTVFPPVCGELRPPHGLEQMKIPARRQPLLRPGRGGLLWIIRASDRSWSTVAIESCEKLCIVLM